MSQFDMTEQELYSRPMKWCRDAKPGDTSPMFDLAVYKERTLRARVSAFMWAARWIYTDERQRRRYRVSRRHPEINGKTYPMIVILCEESTEKMR